MFSLGVTLYELCRLRHLFTGASEGEVQRRIEAFGAADAARAGAELLPWYSRELAGLLESMLQVGRAARCCRWRWRCRCRWRSILMGCCRSMGCCLAPKLRLSSS